MAVENKSYRAVALECHIQAVAQLDEHLEANTSQFDEMNVSLAALGMCIFEVGNLWLHRNIQG